MINSIVTHLVAETSGFAVIENARDSQPVAKNAAVLPALFVYKKSGVGDESPGDVKVRQKHTAIICVQLICNSDDFDTNEQQLFDALLGYQVNPNYDGMTYLSDESVNITGKVQWQEYLFSTWRTIREV